MPRPGAAVVASKRISYPMGLKIILFDWGSTSKILSVSP